MKSKFLNIFLILGLVVAFASCEKDEDRAVVKSDITANELSDLSASTYILTLEEATNVFSPVSWTEVDFGFPASVTYVLQIDSAGKNFANAVDVVSIVSELTDTLNVGEFNKLLLDNGFEPDAAVNLEFRVKATINSDVDPVYSSVVTAMVTPYPTVFPPIYMVGGATGGWDWNHEVEMRSSAPSLYSTVAYFINNDIFRFFKQQDWGPTSYNYLFFDGGFVTDSLALNANDADNNFKVLSPSGYYKITVDLKRKIVDFDAVPEPEMYMTGAAVGGWDWSTNYVQMTWVSHGIFEAETEFINGEAFRFFAQADWGPTSYNYPYFSDGEVDALFENAGDGDSNFKFVGTTGIYKVTLNLLDYTVTMAEVSGK